MKRDHHGQGKVLSPSEIDRLFSEGFQTNRDRALFGICLYAGCRIAESCSVLTTDIYGSRGQVHPTLTLRKGNTKGKLATRSIPTHPALNTWLSDYRSEAGKEYLFPGRWGRGHIKPDSADEILRGACIRLNLVGVSTHSFRRTALTCMSSAGVPLRVIQEISGHRSLASLQRYLEVSPKEVEGAIASLSF